MTNNPPRTLVKSRENLQAICKSRRQNGSGCPELEKYEAFDRILLIIWSDIKQLFVSYTPISKHVINLHSQYLITYQPLVRSQEFTFELIELLKKEYPGVDFTYKETAGYDGNILERVIIMDWS